LFKAFGHGEAKRINPISGPAKLARNHPISNTPLAIIIAPGVPNVKNVTIRSAPPNSIKGHFRFIGGFPNITSNNRRSEKGSAYAKNGIALAT
jgi:hypothetical protein